jgi:hypothetical protein
MYPNFIKIFSLSKLFIIIPYLINDGLDALKSQYQIISQTQAASNGWILLGAWH